MQVDFHISPSERKKFVRACEAAITSVGSGTLEGVMDATQEIMFESMNQVPRDTGTLAKSAFIGVSRRTDVKSYRYGAVLGYGNFNGVSDLAGLGGINWIWPPNNGINPRNKLRASVYATDVHENLNLRHPNGGKAKFLEDPIRQFAGGRYQRTMYRYWQTAIEQIERTFSTNASNATLNRLAKRGELIRPDVSEELETLRNTLGKSYNSRAEANAAAKAAKGASRRIESARTYDAVKANPGNKKYRGYNEYTGTKGSKRWVTTRTNEYTPKLIKGKARRKRK